MQAGIMLDYNVQCYPSTFSLRALEMREIMLEINI